MLGEEEDLPDPPVFIAPKGYETAPADRRQFALACSVNKYEDAEKLPPLPESIERDHDMLRKAVVHPHRRPSGDPCLLVLALLRTLRGDGAIVPTRPENRRKRSSSLRVSCSPVGTWASSWRKIVSS